MHPCVRFRHLPSASSGPVSCEPGRIIISVSCRFTSVVHNVRYFSMCTTSSVVHNISILLFYIPSSLKLRRPPAPRSAPRPAHIIQHRGVGGPRAVVTLHAWPWRSTSPMYGDPTWSIQNLVFPSKKKRCLYVFVAENLCFCMGIWFGPLDVWIYMPVPSV